MSILWSSKFKRNYKRLPAPIRKKFQKQLAFFLDNVKHPSLRVKKMEGREYVWEARIDKFYRFTFQKEGKNLILRTVGPHDEALRR